MDTKEVLKYLGDLADLETYLTGCQHNAAPGSKAQKRFDDWRKAVNKARAYIIANETNERMQEDDGK